MMLLRTTVVVAFVLGLSSNGFAKDLHDTSGQKGHKAARCENKGGTVKDYGSYASICKFKGTTCPANWKRAKDGLMQQYVTYRQSQ